ncbi:rod shape-determining protein MreC [Calditrichota bacterium]
MNLLVLLSRFKDWVALVLALILSIIFMNSSSYPAAEKFRFGLGKIISYVTTPLTLVPRTIEIWGDNVMLRAENVRLSTEQSRWRDAALENIRLRKMLGFNKREEFKYIAAAVNARNPAMNMSTLLIDKGSEDGIGTGQAVITPEGLLGVIFRSDKQSSIIQLATDPNFAVSARVERSRVDGIIRWRVAEKMLLDDITKNQDVREGDRIITSGLGGVIPAGIPFGLVTRIEKERTELFLDIEVDPYVSFYRLEEVFVLVPLESDTTGGDN